MIGPGTGIEDRSRMSVREEKLRLVIFGASNIVSDLFDCALANHLVPAKVVIDLPEDGSGRSMPVAVRAARLAPMCPPPVIEPLHAFQPAAGEVYLLGPTTPTRARLARELQDRFDLRFHTLVHPTAYVSPLATIGAGTFVGARSVIAAGAARRAVSQPGHIGRHRIGASADSTWQQRRRAVEARTRCHGWHWCNLDRAPRRW